MNTYAGKLIGYPYLKVTINHPTSFSYSYKGYIDNNKLKLTITGTVIYNCPDTDSGDWAFHLFKSNFKKLDVENITYNPINPKIDN